MNDNTTQVDQVLKALSDPTRRQILQRLATAGVHSASSLADHYPISRQAIAKHLNVLTSAGLVTHRRKGKEQLYEALPQQLSATGRWLMRTAARWQAAQAITD